MGVNLVNLIASLESMNIDAERAKNAIGELHGLLSELDEVEVKGRKNVDALLGCMMGIDMIIGKEDGNGR